MAEVLTESFCERCGTRYTFESAQPRIKRLKGVKVLSRGLKNFVLSDDSSLDEAMAAARSDTDREVTAHQLDAFHKTFNFCMTCRQYTCANCWNDGEGACLTCSPHLGREILPAPFPDLDPSLGITMALGAEMANGNGADSNGHAPHTLDVGAWPTSDLVQPVDDDGAPAQAIDEVDVEARMAALTAIGVDQPAAADTASSDTAPSEDDAEAVSPVAGYPAEAPVEAGVAAETEIAVEGVEAVETPTDIAVQATTAPRTPTTTDEVAAAAAAQTAALFHRFRPGQNLDDEIEAYEREQMAATSVSASEATVAPGPAPIIADDEAERAAAAALALAALAEAAAPVAIDSAAPDLATERRPTDIVAQPTWQIVAPDVEPLAPVTVPAAPSAPSTPPAASAAAQPSWPAKPEWPSNQPAAALPFLGRMAQPTGGLESLWAESNREVASAAPDAGRPAPGGVQPCVSCGLSLSATARFCRRCGTSQVA